MEYIIQSNLPICPKCRAPLAQRQQDNHLYLWCVDCFTIYKVIGRGLSDREYRVVDSAIKKRRKVVKNA